MKTLMMLPILGLLLWASVQGGEKAQPPTETTAGWVKYAKNPVLGGNLGTCFDISVLKEGDKYRCGSPGDPRKVLLSLKARTASSGANP